MSPEHRQTTTTTGADRNVRAPEVTLAPDTPTAAACAVCNSPTGDSARICRTHTDALRLDLHSVAWLGAELDVTITRQSRITAGHHGARSSTTPLPWNENAAARLHELHTTLNAWALDTARLAEDDRDPLADHPHHDLPAVASWLVRNLCTLRQHHEAGVAYDQLTDSVHQARRAIDRPLDLTTYGPCQAEQDDGTRCSETLYAPPGRETIACRCGVRHSAQVRREWMLNHCRSLKGTASQIASWVRIFGIEASTDRVRALAARNRFERAGERPRPDGQPGQPLYRLRDVVIAMGNRHQRLPQEERVAS